MHARTLYQPFVDLPAQRQPDWWRVVVVGAGNGDLNAGSGHKQAINCHISWRFARDGTPPSSTVYPSVRNSLARLEFVAEHGRHLCASVKSVQ